MISLAEPFREVRGIYFDLDDTLCGYWQAAKAGLRATFELHRLPGLETDEMLEHWATAFRDFCPHLKRLGWYEGYLKQSEPTRTELMRLTLMRVGIEDPLLTKNLSQAYLEQRDRNLKMFPDALELLSKLHGLLPLGLITNGPADLQRLEIATLGIESWFDHVFIEGEMGFGKPEPEVFRAAEGAMGFAPEQLLFVGNSYGHDIRPAIEAGWRTAWIRRPTDVPPSAKGVTAKPEELPQGAPAPDLMMDDLRLLLAAD